MGQPEPTLLELDGQLTGWIDLSKEEGDGLPRVRLTYVPSALWSQLVSRQDAMIEAVGKLRDNLHRKSAETMDADLSKIGDLTMRAQLLSLQLIGMSIREVEGFEALRIGEDGGVDPAQVEKFLACGWTDAMLDIVIRVHRLDHKTWRSLLCGGMGESMGAVSVQRVPAAG